jgi:capsular polysaccharide biosynthesis protein
VIYPEELDFAEQIRLLRHASFIVAPNGSAIYLAFFARPGARLCVLNHPYTIEILDQTGILSEVGVDITMLTGSYAKQHEEYPHFADYEIDPKGFSDFLDRWVAQDVPTPIRGAAKATIRKSPPIWGSWMRSN